MLYQTPCLISYAGCEALTYQLHGLNPGAISTQLCSVPLQISYQEPDRILIKSHAAAHLKHFRVVLVLDDVHGVGADVHDGGLHLGAAEGHGQVRVRHDLLQHLRPRVMR